MRLLGIGDNVMDAYLFQNKLYPGGNAVNVAVLAGRFGAQAGYLGILANDAPAISAPHCWRRGLISPVCARAKGAPPAITSRSTKAAIAISPATTVRTSYR